MGRMTIDFGIDLGTTNSEVAVLKGTEAVILKNNDGQDYTPSAVWIDSRNKLWVGQKAKGKAESDEANTAIEFKLQMGYPWEKSFAASGRKMTPEELSAEVLKSLRETINLRLGENPEGVVITVPAAFMAPQTAATQKAAALAGFKQTILVQEPVAAALVHGFQSSSEKVFWLVYDFGGGTFDAAVMHVRNQQIEVVTDKGDNQLGGKLIDWDIVEKLLIPAVSREFKLTDLRRGDVKWRSVIARLKAAAERGKIEVSSSESTTLTLELQKELGGDFEFELLKTEVEKIAEPYILRSINLSKEALLKQGLDPSKIEKVILVGGPTAMPYLRERLLDPKKGLGIPLDFSEDPLTVVARGAAIFAGTQRLASSATGTVAAGEIGVELDYKPTGPDTEPDVGGRVIAGHIANFSGYTIEFVNTTVIAKWRSGKVGLGADGKFLVQLYAEKGKPNKFVIELHDPTGKKVDVTPSEFTYTVSIEIGKQHLPYSIGVATADGSMHWFFEKGQPLKARARHDFLTVYEVRPGGEGFIRIPIKGGENNRADRNRAIGALEIPANKISRAVPVGSLVEVTIEIDESQSITFKAFIGILDEEFEEKANARYDKYEPAAMRKELVAERKRLESVRDQSKQTQDPTAQDIMIRIDQELMVQQVEASLDAAEVDPDAAQKAAGRLLDLKQALDQAEEAVAWPTQVAEAEKLITLGKELIRDHGNNDDVRGLGQLETEIRAAIQMRDSDLLRKKIEEYRGFIFRVLDRKGIMQFGWFEDLVKERAKMRDQNLAEQLIGQGRRAINENNIDVLRAVNRQLAALLPSPPPPPSAESTVVSAKGH